MDKIISVKAREILDSRGNPTVEVDIITNSGLSRASTPSGASTGDYEAVELRDNDKRYLGKGVLNAVENVNKISKKLIGLNPIDQKKIDELMIELDGSENKKNLGANAILPVSMAVCRAGALAKKTSLYRHIAEISGNKELVMPVPSFNVINGGKHAGNKLAIQEFMILPVKASNFKEALKMGTEVYHNLKNLIKKRYGIDSINVGDEGGFAPPLKNNEDALIILNDAIIKSGYKDKIKIGMDVAASEFFLDNKYNINFKDKDKKLMSSTELIEMYLSWINKYQIISIEDPFDQDDFNSYIKLNKKIGNKIQIVGDDLLVTNVKRIKKAVEINACNSLLLKLNQIGSVSEAVDAFKLAKKNKWKVMVSHRSGETEDNFISDLVVGLGAEEIKSGAPCRSERLSKYNQLLRIEEEIKETGKKIKYWRI